MFVHLFKSMKFFALEWLWMLLSDLLWYVDHTEECKFYVLILKYVKDII